MVEHTLAQKQAIARARARARIAQQPPATTQAQEAEQPTLGTFLQPGATPENSFAHGIAQGATFGFADEAGAAVDVGILDPLRSIVHNIPGVGPYLADAPTGQTYQERVDGYRADQAANEKQYGSENFMGRLLGGSALGGGIAGAGGSLGFRAANAGRGLFPTAAGSAVDGAVMAGAQTLGENTGNLVERTDGIGTNMAFGGIFGGAVPFGTAALTNGVRKAITPLGPIDERRLAAADVLRAEGVPITAGQLSGSKGVRNMEATIGAPYASDIMEAQKDAFTQAAMRRTGMPNARNSGPEDITAARDMIGVRFENIAKNNEIQPGDMQIARDVNAVIDTYQEMTPSAMTRSLVTNLADDVKGMITGGITGEKYLSLRTQIGRRASSAGDDLPLRDALYGMQNALDDAMERSIIAKGGDPSVLGAVRNDYRNLLTVERAASGAGADAANGRISPQQLAQAAKTTQGRTNYVGGRGDFADLARAGNALMQPVPDSGTAGRLQAYNLGFGFGAPAAGAMIGSAVAGPAGAGVGTAAGYALPPMIGRMLMSNPGQAWLKNQVVPNTITPKARSLGDALLRGGILAQ